ncbi:hypothetical protein Tco_0658042 [Tanacetum coccineum]
MLKAGKLSHLIKELKQNNGKDQTKVAKKGETLGKDKSLAILMVQPWQRIARQRITQTFSPKSVISFPPLGEEDGTEGLMIIEISPGVAGKDRRWGVLDVCLDELYGGKITLSLQWDYRKTGGKEDPGNPVHGTRNVKIPSGWRDSHITEQQDRPTRMLNGFKIRGAAACH